MLRSAYCGQRNAVQNVNMQMAHYTVSKKKYSDVRVTTNHPLAPPLMTLYSTVNSARLNCNNIECKQRATPLVFSSF